MPKTIYPGTEHGKAGQSIACILLADQLAGECLFPGEKAVDLLEGVGFLKMEAEVSQAERAYQFIIDWIAANENLFDPMYSNKVSAKYSCGFSNLLDSSIIVNER